MTSGGVFMEAPRVIFMQNNISFYGEMIFPGNFSLPVIVLGEVERRHDYLLE
jgi:hypothetical protein